MNPSRRTRLALPALSAVVLAVVLTGCSSGSGSPSTADADAGGTTAAAEAPAPASAGDLSASYAGTADGTTAALSSPADTAKVAREEAVGATQQAIIRTGELQLETDDPAEARTDALSVVRSLRGTIANEQSSSDDKGRVDQVDLTVRVPVSSFDQTLDQLSKLGTVTHRNQSAEDVTTQVIDTDARVKAQAASVASIQRLLARANTIGEIMSIEGQLTRRQAELDSLVQQQKYLKDQTALSTVHVTIERTDEKKDDSEPAGGFVGGLHDGWDALGDSASAAGTALGAALPFAALAALIGFPVWVLVRRNRTGPASAVR